MSHYDKQYEEHQKELERSLEKASSPQPGKVVNLVQLRRILKDNPSDGNAIRREIVEFKNQCHEWLSAGKPEEIASELENLIKRILSHVNY